MNEQLGGLAISRKYYLEIAEPALREEFAELYPRLAAGLVGNGSDRYGFDDESSRDHDWGVDFYLWVTDDDTASIPALNQWKAEILEKYPPNISFNRSQYSRPIAAMSVGDFYQQLIGVSRRPETLSEWTRTPEEQFSLATNGEVWVDGAGKFTEVRTSLLAYLPEDLRRKRLAAKCMEIAQTGQYNHQRMAQRNDWVSVQIIITHFIEATIALVFLLNKVYRPYYKWTYRMMSALPLLGKPISTLLLDLTLSLSFGPDSIAKQQDLISSICDLLICELKNQGLSDSDDWFMASHGEAIQSTITSEQLRMLPTQYEI